MDHHAQRHAQPRQDHRVVAVRVPARLVRRVVAQLGALLVPEVPVARQPQHDARHSRRKDFLGRRRVRVRAAHRAGLRRLLELSARMQECGKL